MKKLFYVLPIIGLIMFASCHKDESNENVEEVLVKQHLASQKKGWNYNYPLATTGEELSKIMDNPDANIVRNVGDFRRYVKANPLLNEVFSDEGLLKNVAATIIYDDRGLKTFSYESIKKKFPSENQLREILVEIFIGLGIDYDTLGVDYKDYRCISQGNCTYRDHRICIGENC